MNNNLYKFRKFYWFNKYWIINIFRKFPSTKNWGSTYGVLFILPDLLTSWNWVISINFHPILFSKLVILKPFIFTYYFLIYILQIHKFLLLGHGRENSFKLQTIKKKASEKIVQIYIFRKFSLVFMVVNWFKNFPARNTMPNFL